MYVGRIVSVGLTISNRLCLMYRVSSRSFPNRVIKDIKGALAVIPSPGSETDIYQNPYISYNCLRHNSEFAVVGNGTHTDPIFEKLEPGEYRFVSTYETNKISTEFGGIELNAQNPREAAQFIINSGEFIEFEKPVSSVAA